MAEEQEPATTTAPANKAPTSFEEALSRLQAIGQSLGDGHVPVAEDLARYEQGVNLLAQCHGTLERAGQRIGLLNHVDAAGRERCEPFDDAALCLEEKAQSRARRRTREERAIPKADEID